MKKVKAKDVIDPDERHEIPYRTVHKRFEYLRRKAFNAGHNSVNEILDDQAFPRTWQTDLERMRAEHRKLGYPYHEFFHAAIKKRLGIKVKTGRYRRILKSSVA